MKALILIAALLAAATSALAVGPTLTDEDKALVAQGLLTITKPAEPYKPTGDGVMMTTAVSDDSGAPATFLYPEESKDLGDGRRTMLMGVSDPMATYFTSIIISCDADSTSIGRDWEELTLLGDTTRKVWTGAGTVPPADSDEMGAKQLKEPRKYICK